MYYKMDNILKEMTYMNIGYCVNMVASEFDRTGIGMDRAGIAFEEMFDYVELPMAQMMALSDMDFRTQVLEPVRERGISVEASNNFAPASLRLTGGDANMNEAADYAKRALDRAAQLGVKVIVFGSSGARNCPAFFSKQAALQQLAKFLRFLGDEGQARGIRFAIEPLNRGESNLVNTLEEGFELARMTDHPHVGVLADSYHFLLGREDTAYLESVADKLFHVHLAQPLGRSLPLEPEEHFDAFMSALQRGGYDGRMSLEAYCPEAFRELSRRSRNRLMDEWNRRSI